MPEQVPPGK